MLKLTRKLEYGLIALSHLRMKRNIISSSKEISQMYMIPREVLAKVLQKMVKLDYIDAVKGPSGGYKLRQSLDGVNLTQFIEEMEGPLGVVDCSINIECNQMDNCNIRIPINKINENIRSIFNKIRILDITN